MATSTLVIVRHGESEFNLKNVFAGWVDTPLTPKGRAQANSAGQALHASGFVPDVVYASTLIRTIDTAKEILKALGMPEREILQKTELLERHYGGLTGMNKKEAEETFGEKKFREFRRSYDIPPPPMDSGHSYHPQNTDKGGKVIGMPENGRGTESLADVVARVKPFWEKVLLPQLQAGKRILIAAHGNSLRALNMIIEHMTPEQVAHYEMKNAEPLLFNLRSAPGDVDWTLMEKRVLATPTASGGGDLVQ